MEAFWAAPPVTRHAIPKLRKVSSNATGRTLAAAIFVESIVAALSLVSPALFIYSPRFVFKLLPEIWRLATSFCLTGGLGILFAPYCVWQYGAPLERNSARFNSASFLVYLLFVGSVIVLLAGHLLGGMVFTSCLTLAITYTFAQENRGQRIQFFVIPMEVKFLPYAILLLTLVQSGPEAAMQEAVGIPAAHLYDFLTIYWPQFGGGSSLLPTPLFLNKFFHGSSDPKQTEVKGHGTAYRAPPQTAPSASSSGFSGPWSSRGQGRRLGGD